ncbi:MAG: hypothetical protein IJ717_01660 [Treponema sp.]|nr:hypothetical protein [Treponema sp.]
MIVANDKFGIEDKKPVYSEVHPKYWTLQLSLIFIDHQFLEVIMGDSEEKSLRVWKDVLKTAVKMPGANVDRDSFLKKELKQYCSDDKVKLAVEKGVIQANIDRNILEKIADGVINYHSTIVTGTSFAAGLPGGFAMLATIPGDIAQFYWHVIVVSQKLAYVYGWPDLFEEGSEPSDEFLMQMSLFIGVMSGVQGANQAIKALSKAFAGQIAKRLPQYALTKVGIYNVAKQVAKWLGVKLTKETFAKGISKSIPILGGLLSAGITLATFPTMAKRLKEELRDNAFGDFIALEKRDYNVVHVGLLDS